jgi:hypothetical protein
MPPLQDPTDIVKAELETDASDGSPTPFDLLPNELLIAIFTWIVFSDTTLSEPAVKANGDCLLAQLYHRPPVVLSHVCRTWRTLTISTSALWSHIVYSAPEWRPDPVTTFLERACGSPLNIFYHHFSSWFTKFIVASSFIEEISKDQRPAQWHEVVFRCQGRTTFDYFVDRLLNPDLLSCGYPQLRSIDLSVWEQPHYEYDGSWTSPAFAHAVQSCPLQRLCLTRVPIYKAPIMLLFNLRTLELEFSFPQASRPLKQRVSDVCRLLACTPRLEDLILINFVLCFDVHVQRETPRHSFEDDTEHDDDLKKTPIIPLKNLEMLIWEHACSTDVHRFLSYLHTPALRVLDLSVSKKDLSWQAYPPHRGQDEVRCDRAWVYTEACNAVLTFPEMAELRVEYPAKDNRIGLADALQKIVFVTLDKLEIVYIGQRFPAPMSQLSSILRDPRVPTLTQLTLRRWHINDSHRTTVFAYMPALVSLELDGCLGVDSLLDGLAECAGVVGSGASRKGVRLCPKLEALTFSRCHGLDYGKLLDLVKIRNTSDWRGGADEVSVGTRTVKPLRKRRLAHPSTPMVFVPTKPTKISYVHLVVQQVEPCEGGCDIPDDCRDSLSALGVDVYLD